MPHDSRRCVLLDFHDVHKMFRTFKIISFKIKLRKSSNTLGLGLGFDCGGGVGLNDSGVSSSCTNTGFPDKERTLARLRFPSSSGGPCQLVAEGIEIDCAKRMLRQSST